jgi:tRNA(Ile2) C34 agmatinyltransferase TiaS
MRLFLLKCPKCGGTKIKSRDRIVFKCLNPKCSHEWKHKDDRKV